MINKVRQILILLIVALIIIKCTRKLKIDDSCNIARFEKTSDFLIDPLLKIWYPVLKTEGSPIVSNCNYLEIKKNSNNSDYLVEILKNGDGNYKIKLNLQPTKFLNEFTFKKMGFQNQLVVADSDMDTYLIIYICSELLFYKKTHIIALIKDKNNSLDKLSNLKKIIDEKIGKYNLETFENC